MTTRNLLAVLLLVYLLLTVLSHGGSRYLRLRLVLLIGLATANLAGFAERLMHS